MEGDSKTLEICHLNVVYPSIDEIFTMTVKTAQEIKNDCLVVLDTNTLLLPYETDTKSLKEIERVYKKLIQEKRLSIPGQVAREFAKNRVNKLTNLHSKLLDQKSRLVPHLNIQKYPLFQASPQYSEIFELENKIDVLKAEYLKSIDNLIHYIRSWNWNDPVSSLYRSLFLPDVISDFLLDEPVIKIELEKRYKNDIPPGYKDQKKTDGGVGDLLIWYTILEEAKKNESNVLFVSGEKKADWFHQSAGSPLYPRFELIDEFYRKTNGKSFQIISFSDFLKLYDVAEAIVEEVRKEEDQLQLSDELDSEKEVKIKNIFSSYAKRARLKNRIEELIINLQSFYNQKKEEYSLKDTNASLNKESEHELFNARFVFEFNSRFRQRLSSLVEEISAVLSEQALEEYNYYLQVYNLDKLVSLIQYLKLLRQKIY